jgi:hypothetical protein
MVGETADGGEDTRRGPYPSISRAAPTGSKPASSRVMAIGRAAPGGRADWPPRYAAAVEAGIVDVQQRPVGCWHRRHNVVDVIELSCTPGTSEGSSDADPRPHSS